MLNYNLYNVDSFQWIKNQQQVNEIDLILTDPPYNISQKSGNLDSMGRFGFDFGTWDYDFDVTGWITPFCNLLKDTGSIIIFSDWKKIGNIVETLKNNNFLIKDCLRFIKSNPLPRTPNRRYVVDYEFAVWATKSKNYIFNKNPLFPYLRPEFYMSVTSGREKLNHPTQKPLELMKQLIQIHSNKGDTVLDAFMGSGTTGVAALSLGRNFVGIELDKVYFQTSEIRIKSCLKELQNAESNKTI